MAVSPTRPAAGGGAVVVTVPSKGVNNLAAVNKIVANTLGRLGCPACLSGFDIRFKQVRDLVVNPQTFEVNEQQIGG